MARDLSQAPAFADPGLPQVAVGPGRNWFNWFTFLSVGFVVGANILAFTGFRLPFLGPALSFWLILIQPVYLLLTTSIWRGSPAAERLSYSLSAVLLALMIAGLAVNTFLPYLGVRRALDPIPVVLIADCLTVALYLYRHKRGSLRLTYAQLRLTGHAESRLVFGSGLCVVLAILGANRLNNGAGDQISLAALGVGLLVLILLLRWREQIREAAICVTLYLLSLSLLLMTSLRGWYVTGHDIQREYKVFQLTAAHGHWTIAGYHDAYNACLSLTILPTEFNALLHVDGPYIYKFFYQLLFALTPALVYTIARRYWQRSIAILAAVYFISLPTFFSDMPFLNRQEIAFLFVCAGFLALINESWKIRHRRIAFVVACTGMELAHYSTLYVLFGILSIAWVIQRLGVLMRHSRTPPSGAKERSMAIGAVSLGSLVAIAVAIFLWGFAATQTTGAALTAAESAFSGLLHKHSSSARSNNVAYSLVFWKSPSLQTVLDRYRDQAIIVRQAAPPYAYLLSTPVVSRYQTPVDAPLLPLTAVGHAAEKLGVPVVRLNIDVRLAAAKGEQLFVMLGLIALVVAPWLRRRLSLEFFSLCAGSTIMLFLVTVLPNLSVEYGVLRVFEQALILIAPVLVVGSITIFRFLGDKWSLRVAAVICLGIYSSTTGLLPQLLGGYPAQLSLNNSGAYYDAYYTHPQEAAAVQWLSHQREVLPANVQAPFSPYRYLFTDPADVTAQEFISDAFPLLVRPSSWVILGYATVRDDLAAASYSGNLILYKYPVALLRISKNLVYNDGGAEIYR